MKNVKASLMAPLFVLILYLLFTASDFLRPYLIEAGGNLYLSVIILQILVFLLPAIVFCRLKGVGHATKLNVKLFSPGKLGAVIMGSLVLIAASILIRFIEIYLFGVSDFHFALFDVYVSGEGTVDFLYTVAAFAIMPALTEEFVFRAILLTEYNNEGYGAVMAALLTSLLSSMMYFSLEKLPIRFVAALIFCVVTYATGSSLAAFFVHLIFNIYGLFGEKYILQALSDPSNRVISIFVFALLFFVLLAIFLGEVEHIYRRLGQSGTETPAYRLKKTEDGKTPDLAATEADEARPEKNGKLSQRTRRAIDAFFSPTFLLCILYFAIAVFGFI